ncbi:MAG TPA: hypothetical protein DEQ02_05695 [Ruminococcaceae bacterium]|nr:hypothetical protein [Oscillospiraceae bacterium]
MKVIVCDNNTAHRDSYSELILKIADKHGVALELSAYDTATSLMFDAENLHFMADLLFIDMNTPNISGDEAARRLRDHGYTGDIIFLSSDKGHYDAAFDVGALHYIIKGKTSQERFEHIFLQAVRSLNKKKQKYAVYYGGGETRNIPIDSILYYEIYHRIAKVHYGQNTCFEFPLVSLSKLEREMSEYGFFRTHKSYLVALCAIESLTYTGITLRDGTSLPMSRNRYTELKELLISR